MRPTWDPPRRGVAHGAFLATCSIDDLAGSPGATAFTLLGALDLLADAKRDAKRLRRGFALARAQLQECDREDAEVQSLEQLLAAGEAALGHTERVWVEEGLVTAFSFHALHLTDRDRSAAAVDVLETEWRLLGTGVHRMSVGTRLGQAYVRARRLRTAASLARGLARDRVPWVRHAGHLLAGDILLAAGRYASAERRFARVEAVAGRRGDPVAVSAARLGRARALRPLGQPVAAALLAWEPNGNLRPAARAELAACLEAAELWEPAQRLAGWNALGFASPEQRWQALAAVVRISARLGDRLALARWVNWAERVREDGMPGPRARAQYDAEVARARAAFSGHGAGEREEVAVAVAPLAELAAILAWVEASGDPWTVVQPRA